MNDAAEKPAAAAASDVWSSRFVGRILARVVSPRVLVMRGSVARVRKATRVAFTFDGGPGAMTPRYLDECDRLAVRATFFLVGENMSKHPGSVLEYVRRGHEVAGLGFTQTPFPSLAPAMLVDELTRTSDLLPPSRTTKPLVRPPRGAVNAVSIARVAAAGYTTALWSLDSGDAATRDPRAIEARIVPENVADGEILRFHEEQPWTLEALPRIVGRLHDAGYETCTLSEMLDV